MRPINAPKHRLNHIILGGVVFCCLLGFFIRTHHIQRQEVFVDEAYHITRAAVVWDFEQHPARFAHGKLLLYFWLGVFETDSLIALPVARLATGLFALLNGALVFLLGRLLYNDWAGLVALGLYMVLPLAFFFERLALADSFAGVFVYAVMWRSLVFARRPSLREGAILGVLLSLTTLAKLTMGLVPFLPVVISLIDMAWRGEFSIRGWLKRYFPPLVLAALIVILVWLPILIPAALALSSDHQFVLIDSANLQQLEDSDPIGKFSEVSSLLRYYMGWWFTAGLVFSLIFLLFSRSTRRQALRIIALIASMAVLSLVAATTVRTRYLMPLSGAFVLLISLACVHLWYQSGVMLRSLMIIGIGLWFLGFSLPFMTTMFDAPATLNLSQSDWVRYMSGNFSGDALRHAAEDLNKDLNQAQPPNAYATWGTCQLLYLYTVQEVVCLPPSDADWEAALANQLRDEQSGLVVLNGDMPSDDTLPITWEQVACYSRPHIERAVCVWRVAYSRGM